MYEKQTKNQKLLAGSNQASKKGDLIIWKKNREKERKKESRIRKQETGKYMFNIGLFRTLSLPTIFIKSFIRVHAIGVKLVSEWEQDMLLTSSEVSSLACKCVFYKPEHNAKWWSHEIEFWRSWNAKMKYTNG